MEAKTLNAFEDGMQDQEAMQDMYMVFEIADQSYAIEVRYVIEIIEVLPIFTVPGLPGCMKGIINLRGAVIPIMDVRLRFGLPEVAHTERTCIIVIENDGVSLGLIVDAVQEVCTIAEEQRMLPSTAGVGAGTRYINGVGSYSDSIQLLLDCDRLMDISA